MYKDVFKNLICSIEEPQLINTTEEEIEIYFNNGKTINVAHAYVNLRDVASYVEMLVMNNEWFLGDIWMNLKGNLNMNDVSDLMLSINEKIMTEAIISVTFDDREEFDIEVSMIAAMPIKRVN